MICLWIVCKIVWKCIVASNVSFPNDLMLELCELIGRYNSMMLELCEIWKHCCWRMCDSVLWLVMFHILMIWCWICVKSGSLFLNWLDGTIAWCWICVKTESIVFELIGWYNIVMCWLVMFYFLMLEMCGTNLHDCMEYKTVNPKHTVVPLST